MSLDDLGFTDVIELYKKKDQYTKEGNLNELIRLKNSFPELFNEQKEMEIAELLNTVNYIAEMPHFQAMREKEQKKKYIQIDYQNWQVGNLENVLAKYPQVRLSNMDIVTREMIKEAISGSRDILCSHENKSIPINDVFPYLGYLLMELISQFPVEKRQHKFKLAMFKLSGKEREISETIHVKYDDKQPLSLKDQAIKDYFYMLIKMVSQKFDHREGFYSDSIFFCLMEAAEFIGLLIPHIGIDTDVSVNDVVNKINEWLTGNIMLKNEYEKKLGRVKLISPNKQMKEGSFPNIELQATTGEKVSIAKIAQTNNIVLFFYPGDKSGIDYPELAGCTPEACSFRDAMIELERFNTKIFGISYQSTERQCEFIKNQHLNFQLLSDSAFVLSNAIGLPYWLSEKGERYPKRQTFIIKQGNQIYKAFDHVEPSEHINEVINEIKNLTNTQF